MSVRFADSALADLNEIRLWIARDDPVRALSFVQKLKERTNTLAGMPERCPEVDPKRRPGIRRLNHRGYRILYVVENGDVQVLHVHHGRRRYPDLA